MKSKYIIIQIAISLLCASCATTSNENVTETAVDDQLMNTFNPMDTIIKAINEDRCADVYEALASDVQAHFRTVESFCNYFKENKIQFIKWSSMLEDRFIANDYERYVYLSDDPNGAIRFQYRDNLWRLEDGSHETADLQELKYQFVEYVNSVQFVAQLQDFLEKTDPLNSEKLLGDVLNARLNFGENCKIEYEGPFAKLYLDENVQLIFIYRKNSYNLNTWELYRCLSNL